MAASKIWAHVSSVYRRSIFYSAVRCASGPPSKPEDIHKGKVFSDACSLPDSYGHSVGIERQELLIRETGDDDPFQMKIIRRSKGTFEEPTIITSTEKKRMIGCICEEDSASVSWLWIHKGEPKRCECGYWYKLVDAKGCGHH